MSKLYNVNVTFETTMVVLADDAAHAISIAQLNARRAIDDGGEEPDLVITGEVQSASDLKLNCGWDVDCSPYGDKNYRSIKHHLEATKG